VLFTASVWQVKLSGAFPFKLLGSLLGWTSKRTGGGRNKQARSREVVGERFGPSKEEKGGKEKRQLSFTSKDPAGRRMPKVVCKRLWKRESRGGRVGGLQNKTGQMGNVAGGNPE